jgi:UDP-glucose 4-epimerase
VVYGHARSLPIKEDHPTDPVSPYGITKLAVEKYALMYWKTSSLPVVCVRPGNGYGEGQRAFAGQGFIATAIASVLEQRELSLFGESGTIRDYIHVADLAHAIVAALDRGKAGECYNIGTGIGRSNREILEALARLCRPMGLEPIVRVLPARPFDVAANVLDSTKLRVDTEWSPMVSFEVGLTRTWEWFVEQSGLVGSCR